MLNYVKQIFSAENVASYGRWSSLIALITVLVWGTCYFFVNGKIADVPNGWLAIILAPYGITSIADVVKFVKGAPSGN